MDIQMLAVTVSSLPTGDQAHSTHNARAMLPAETFEKRESLLSHSLAKPRYEA
jgi:hypothetical protein